MTESYLCISIPVELQQYQKVNKVTLYEDNEQPTADFGVKIVKNSHGDMEYAAYYSECGELLKKIFYKGSAVSCIRHYRDNIMRSQEVFDNGKLKRKIKYNKSGKETSTTYYEYDSQNQIVAIRKITNNKKYEVEYGYDELSRVDSRVIKLDSKIHLQQKYRYDILDRVVEYHDRNQHIKVHKINNNNELLSYTITDIAGNNIIINNKYLCSDYIGTEIDLNGHKTVIKDKCYVDNVMLKKPFTSEDDLDLVLSSMLKGADALSQTVREDATDISDCIISKGINNQIKPVLNNVKPLDLCLD